MSELTQTAYKSSAEILSELFSSFNAEPPDLEKDTRKKHKKSKKKHKHKEKKHKKKSKHRTSSSSTEDSNSEKEDHHKHKSKKKNKSKDLDLSRVEAEPVDKKTELLITKIKEENEDKDTHKVENSSSQSTTQSDKYSETKEIVREVTADKTSTKITIKNLKNSSVYQATIKEVEDKAREKVARFEDGEVTETENDNYESDENSINKISSTKEKSKSSDKRSRRRKRSHSRSDKDKDKISKSNDSKKSKTERHRTHRSRSRDRDSKKDSYYSRKLSYSHRDRDRVSSNYDRYRSRNDRQRSRSTNTMRSRISRDRSIYRNNKRKHSKSPSSAIDKKKLLEIARKNAINMLKSGTLPDALTLGPQAQEKVIAAIKAGGKTVEELTDFCKNLSQKEALGELSSVSSNEEEPEIMSENEKVFHHPFQIKDKPSSIVMNIKNAVPLPVKTLKEKSAELRMQFPVSSGQLHRKTENEWVPVAPKTEQPSPLPPPLPPVQVPPPAVVEAPLPVPPVVTEPVVAAPKPQISVPAAQPQNELDISSIVSQRLHAMRKLQENPNNVEALNQLHRVQMEMENWAQSKQQPGQFTGTTGAQILSAAELSSGYQAWARKDQLQNAAPVTGGMGMHLLQKMGWKPGEGLGKEKTGSLEPLLLEVKLDKKGLVANEEAKGKRTNKVVKTNTTVKTLAGKHPVSLLGEYATKRKLGPPAYTLCFECGPDHKKNFLYKVVLDGIEYKANVASSTKKQAKADAATICLQQLGILIS